MQLIETIKVTNSVPSTDRAIYTFPALASLTDGTLLLTCRSGSTKDSADETVKLFRSEDYGQTWSGPESPFARALVNGAGSSFRLCYLTELAEDHLLAASMWIDRQTYPGNPLFDPETEGCLPMVICLADSFDQGKTWSTWQSVPLPEEIGPPSLTNPVLQLPDGTLVMSIETNKHYLDRSQWFQRVVHFHSSDRGKTWGQMINTGYDPCGRIFNWDQRAGVTPSGEIVTYTWTYDRETNTYRNIQRRNSQEHGMMWSAPYDLGFADQPSHPAIVPDGRVVLAWVDRFKSQSIRARVASSSEAEFDYSTEVVLYEHPSTIETGKRIDTGDMLASMGIWSFGLPYAEVLPDGDVAVAYYAGDNQTMDIYFARLRLTDAR